MPQGENGNAKKAPRSPHVGRGPVLGEIVEDGDKQYAVIGCAANKLFAVVLVADFGVDGPARMYAMPMHDMRFDPQTKTWKTGKKGSSIITDISEFFKRGR